MTKIGMLTLVSCATWSLLGCAKFEAPVYVVLNETAHELSDVVVSATAGDHGAPALEFRCVRLESGKCFVLGSPVPDLYLGNVKSAQRWFEPSPFICCWNEVVTVRLTQAGSVKAEYYYGGNSSVDAAVREYRASLASAR